jgi:predicted protein tyrosine phosphatase
MGTHSRLGLPSVQVFGQPELEHHLQTGGAHHTHLVSIGNPRAFLGPERPDTRMPSLFRRHFAAILRLSFFDVEYRRHLPRRVHPKRVPHRSDVRRALRFFEETRAHASGYTIHCWQGVSRSTAFALGFLYLLEGSESEAGRILQEHRPQAGPHRRIVGWFDAELGSHLLEVADQIRAERMARWKRELDLTEDSLLEELAVVDDEEQA